MKCHEAKRSLDLFMDGELSVPENMKVLEHLNLCRPCASLYEADKAVRGVLKRDLGAVRAPAGLPERLSRALSGGEVLARRRWGAAAAAVFFVALGATLVFTPSGESPRAFASEVVDRHRDISYLCGGTEPDRCCVCVNCTTDPAAAMNVFFARHGRKDFCFHDLDKVLGGYRYAGAAVWPHRGREVCWSTHRDDRGRTISHALLSTPLAAELKPALVESGGRRVLFVPRPDLPGATCVFVFDDAAEADRFMEKAGIPKQP